MYSLPKLLRTSLQLGCAPGATTMASLSFCSQEKSAEDVKTHGGVEGLAKLLCASLQAGLAPDAKGLAQRRAAFGANKFKEVEQRTFLRLLVDNLRDPTLILLMVAAAVGRSRLSHSCYTDLLPKGAIGQVHRHTHYSWIRIR